MFFIFGLYSLFIFFLFCLFFYWFFLFFSFSWLFLFFCFWLILFFIRFWFRLLLLLWLDLLFPLLGLRYLFLGLLFSSGPFYLLFFALCLSLLFLWFLFDWSFLSSCRSRFIICCLYWNIWLLIPSWLSKCLRRFLCILFLLFFLLLFFLVFVNSWSRSSNCFIRALGLIDIFFLVLFNLLISWSWCLCFCDSLWFCFLFVLRLIFWRISNLFCLWWVWALIKIDFWLNCRLRGFLSFLSLF